MNNITFTAFQIFPIINKIYLKKKKSLFKLNSQNLLKNGGLFLKFLRYFQKRKFYFIWTDEVFIKSIYFERVFLTGTVKII